MLFFNTFTAAKNLGPKDLFVEFTYQMISKFKKLHQNQRSETIISVSIYCNGKVPGLSYTYTLPRKSIAILQRIIGQTFDRFNLKFGLILKVKNLTCIKSMMISVKVSGTYIYYIHTKIG